MNNKISGSSQGRRLNIITLVDLSMDAVFSTTLAITCTSKLIVNGGGAGDGSRMGCVVLVGMMLMMMVVVLFSGSSFRNVVRDVDDDIDGDTDDNDHECAGDVFNLNFLAISNGIFYFNLLMK